MERVRLPRHPQGLQVRSAGHDGNNTRLAAYSIAFLFSLQELTWYVHAFIFWATATRAEYAAALEFRRLDDAQIDGLCSLMCSIRAPHTQSANLTVDSTLAAAMCPSTVSDAVDIVNARLPRTCSAVAGDALQSVWEGAKWLGWLVKVLLIWAAFVVYMAGVGASMSVFMRRF